VFEKSVVIHAPIEEVFAFHEREDALPLLTPAFPPVRVIRKSGGIEPGGRVELRVGPFRWLALHTEYEKPRLFVDEQIEGPMLYVTLAISLSFAILLFFLTPATAGHYLGEWLKIESAWLTNLVEGIIRILILVGYIWLISRMEDIQRVFGYHGAEHKVINAFEDGAELTPEVVQTYSLEHPRCGTAFLLTVMVFSVILFTLLGPIDSIWLKLLTRIVLVPVLAGISYEYIRWTAKHLDSKFVQAIIKPNLALQHLTTNPPDLKMLEVSIASFNAMRAQEEAEAVSVL